jgi:hypothetical protein
VCDGFKGILVFTAQGSQLRKGFCTALHGQLNESVAGAAGRGRAHDLNLLIWQGWVDVAPLLIGVGDQLTALRDVFCKSQENLPLGQLERWGRFGVGQDDAVIADLNLGDGYAGFGAFCEL